MYRNLEHLVRPPYECPLDPGNLRYFQWRYGDDSTPTLTFDLTGFISAGYFRTVGDLKTSLYNDRLLTGATGPGDVQFIGHENAQDSDAIEKEFGDEGKSKENPFIVKLLQPLPKRSEVFSPKEHVDTQETAARHHSSPEGGEA
ncbi:unnamed protein product [Vitrella brassicaformis CCMP3155]|uniref:Uncharacterized protein n=2 Tax=Vitrella brassicaformis TaxID=1169539 RepID=A0A0G4GG57_VITBC|nr:unnamed protein product [Vitrella brassicaformis CCMP3155]|eukprot:CEM28598.1 unnamed protein product [Vitrella brassicaformis CCMP3155]